ncbi:MAG: conjugative transfer signal peptidase TraF [Gemmatimonadota bacterium]
MPACLGGGRRADWQGNPWGVRAWRRLSGGAAVAALAFGMARGAGLRVNVTPSVAAGIYRMAPAELTRGTLVLACLPARVAAVARDRRYVSRGGRCAAGLVPIGKRILAISGDTVRVTLNGLIVNGVAVPRSQPLTRDSRGQPLPSLVGNAYTLGPDEVWLFGDHSPLSFDSRYFGPVHARDLRGGLRPLWVLS